jgi:hypothetical protein
MPRILDCLQNLFLKRFLTFMLRDQSLELDLGPSEISAAGETTAVAFCDLTVNRPRPKVNSNECHAHLRGLFCGLDCMSCDES